MDTQKVEKYAGVVSKIATGLKVWNIIGIFANLFVLIGVASTFVLIMYFCNNFISQNWKEC